MNMITTTTVQQTMDDLHAALARITVPQVPRMDLAPALQKAVAELGDTMRIGWMMRPMPPSTLKWARR